MYNAADLQTCLAPTVTMPDAAIYALTYITDTNLTDAAPQAATIADIKAAILKGSITKMMGDVIRLKKLTNDVKTVIDDFTLFEGRADFNNKNANKGRFVGFEIGVKSNSDISVNIFRVSFQIDMPCPDLKVYLFHSETDDAVSETPCNYTQSRSVQYFDIPLVLNNQEGRYYLGYFESDLAAGAQSINKAMNLTEEPCSGCGGMELTRKYYLTREKYIEMQPCYVDASNLNGVELFDTDKVNTVTSNNWGMNFKASVSCDISDFICRNKALFYDTLSIRYAIDLLEYMLMSTRNNAFVEKIKDGVLFLRDGDKANGVKGLTAQYERSIEALNLDLSGFNAACLPCARNWGVRQKTIG